jgi:cytochrome c oxidase cbb3-type subunit 3
MQGRWLQPRSFGRGGRGGRGGAAATGAATSRTVTTVAVTLKDGKTLSGPLERLDDFNVAFRDAAGDYHSFARNADSPKVVVTDPSRAHTELLRKYTDADIHNVTAYLETLK